jgi:hypothetical protein
VIFRKCYFVITEASQHLQGAWLDDRQCWCTGRAASRRSVSRAARHRPRVYPIPRTVASVVPTSRRSSDADQIDTPRLVKRSWRAQRRCWLTQSTVHDNDENVASDTLLGGLDQLGAQQTVGKDARDRAYPPSGGRRVRTPGCCCSRRAPRVRLSNPVRNGK